MYDQATLQAMVSSHHADAKHQARMRRLRRTTHPTLQDRLIRRLAAMTHPTQADEDRSHRGHTANGKVIGAH
ncbi:MAG: hypothetical protein ACOC9I_00710 [Actinomycetota bacterium]